MRVKIHLRGSGILPFDYHYHLSSAMYHYKEIANRELAAKLHYSSNIKVYTFSEIIVPNRKIRKKEPKGIEILGDYSYIIYTSPIKEYVEAVVEGMLSEPTLRVGRLKFIIERIEVLETPDVSWGDVLFKTISPIVMYTSSDGKKKDKPLFPSDTRWYVNLEKNIKHSYEETYGEVPRGKIVIETMHSKPKKYLFRKIENGKKKEGAIHAVHGHFRFQGTPELIRFAYESGVGERGAQGFGCVEVVNKEDNS